MKTLSILQPWASLLGLGLKKIETRPRYTKYRGPLAIHASTGLPKAAKEACKNPVIYEQLCQAGLIGFKKPETICSEGVAYEVVYKFSRGAVISTCNLVNVFYIGEDGLYEYSNTKVGKRVMSLPAGNEFVYGDYTPGRFALITNNNSLLAEPIPAKGQLGLWNWEPEGMLI